MCVTKKRVFIFSEFADKHNLQRMQKIRCASSRYKAEPQFCVLVNIFKLKGNQP